MRTFVSTMLLCLSCLLGSGTGFGAQIRVEVFHSSATAINNQTNQVIARFDYFKDFKVRGSIVVLRDQYDFAAAYTAGGLELVRWERTVDYKVGDSVVALLDDHKLLGAYNAQGQGLVQWERTQKFDVTRRRVFVLDSEGWMRITTDGGSAIDKYQVKDFTIDHGEPAVTIKYKDGSLEYLPINEAPRG